MANLWNTFVSLIPRKVRVVGTIVGTTSTGNYIASLVNGGSMTCKGAAGLSNGTKVYIGDGIIEGTAPTLPSGEVELF